MGCYLEDDRACVGTWAARTSWATRTKWRTSQGNVRVIPCLGTMILCATTLVTLLVIGGVEKNPGPCEEAEKVSKFCVESATEISNRELDVRRVDAGSVTGVVMRRAGKGSLITSEIDRRDSGCQKKTAECFTSN